MGCARIRRKSWKVSESEQRSSVNFEITSNFSKALSSAMEITSEGASNVELKPLSNIVLGRGSGCITTDLTVSCRHMLFWLGDCSNGTKTEPRAYFQRIHELEEEKEMMEAGESSELSSGGELESVDVSSIDPVKDGGMTQVDTFFLMVIMRESSIAQDIMEDDDKN
ncbi:hypothetical protein CUMW_218390 [Citrus unshiu]|uniref:FHA domain-containing protein n=1 Tax=Citrus unshiu TaxID=55188 RepID=A0A2H5QD46_CITUN|nr:hypothetical protein CUMW_218390 [Citrus unshiu]